MKYLFKIDRVAIHYVDAKNDRLAFAPQEVDVAKLDPRIGDFFLELVTEVWEEKDAGNVGSARFVLEDNEDSEGTVVKNCVDQILKSRSDFFSASKKLAKHLYKITPNNAPAGLLAVIRVTHLADQSSYVALMKIRHKDEDIIKASGRELTQLDVEDIQNRLVKEIQKAAISPHPSKKEYDLKLVDKQVGEQTKYFPKFLGCQSKQSDEHQVKRLLPTMETYAENRKIPIKKERLHRVVVTLLSKGDSITTSSITEAVGEIRVFGDNFDQKDFEKYLQQESDIGPVDIPFESFAHSGKTAKAKRNITYRFKGEDYGGLTIKGRPEVFDRIISTERDKVIFRVETTKEGFSVIHE